MPESIILASGSPTRQRLLAAAGVPVTVIAPHIDEDTARRSLHMENAGATEISTALAELKARKISQKYPESLVIGSDQVLEFEGRPLGKSQTPAEARRLLVSLRGKTHQLHSSAVACRLAAPVWRHTGTATIRMRNYSDAYLDRYIERHRECILDSVGCYRIEEEGVRLIASITGEYFTICGLPLIPLLAYLADAGVLEH